MSAKNKALEKTFRDERFFFANANNQVSALFKGLWHRFPNLFSRGGKIDRDSFGQHYHKLISGNEEQRFRERLNISAGDPAKLKAMKVISIYEYFFVLNEIVTRENPKKENERKGRH